MKRVEIEIDDSTTEFTIVFPIELDTNTLTRTIYLGTYVTNTDEYTSKPYQHLQNVMLVEFETSLTPSSDTHTTLLATGTSSSFGMKVDGAGVKPGTSESIVIEAKVTTTITTGATDYAAGFTFIGNYDYFSDAVPNDFGGTDPCLKIEYPAGDHRKYGIFCKVAVSSTLTSASELVATTLQLPYREGKTIVAYGGVSD
jgi:hypothetical protein